MAIFARSRRMLRGPSRRALSLYGGHSGILSHFFDLTLGSCTVTAQTVNASVFNALQTSAWQWQSYDKNCSAYNSLSVSGGGLVPSGLGYGTIVFPQPNIWPSLSSAFIQDTVAPSS